MIILRLGRFLLGMLLLAAVLCWTGCDGGTVHVDFEDLASGAAYHVGDAFTDSGVTMTGAIFWWDASTSTDIGVATVLADGHAGGTGKELWTNNINIVFDFGGPCRDLTLHLGEYGGNLNIMINGDSRIFADFADIDGLTIGGVAMAVSTATVTGGYLGTLTLTGAINTFSIGGQEFCLDDVSTTLL